MKIYLLIAISVLCLAFMVINCGTDDDQGMQVLPGSGDLGFISTPIYYGSPPDAPEHDAVVGLHRLDKKGTSVYVSPFCTGTLISSDVVLTAAHCLNVAPDGKPQFRTMKPSALAIYVGDDPAQDILDHMYFVSETVIYPSYNPVALRNDIALIRLSTQITEPVAPVAYLPAAQGFTSADIGSLLNFAGFGVDEFGNSGVKLQADVALGGLGCTVAGCPGSGDTATQISYTQTNAGPCFGDSGGPAFVYRSLVPYVGGVTSYGDSNCTVYGVSTRVDAFDGWIDVFVNGQSGPDCTADGFCNPDCDAGADPDCSVANDCGNGVCDADESCDGRYDTVSCSSDCPGKTTGKPSGRFCYVGGACEGSGC